MLTHSFVRRLLAVSALVLLIAFVTAGCKSTGGKEVEAPVGGEEPPRLALAAGDVVEVSFPGATNLSGMHRVGPEGSVTLPLVGQVQAAGKTAEELQKELVGLYGNELKDSTVLVAIAGSGNVVYITGAVLRPGKVALERPLTALEAIMEAGGFNDVANKKKVTVVRYVGNKNTNITLNLDPVLSGGPVPPFYIQPRDIIHVPSKIQWF